MSDRADDREDPYSDLAIRYDDLDLDNRFARQVMLIERERCAKAVESMLYGIGCTDDLPETIALIDTALSGAAAKIRSGE